MSAGDASQIRFGASVLLTETQAGTDAVVTIETSQCASGLQTGLLGIVPYVLKLAARSVSSLEFGMF
jgi:hypothetical protein